MFLFSFHQLFFIILKSPFGYVGVLQEEDVEPSDGQRNVLNQLRDWDLWCVLSTELLYDMKFYYFLLFFQSHVNFFRTCEYFNANAVLAMKTL